MIDQLVMNAWIEAGLNIICIVWSWSTREISKVPQLLHHSRTQPASVLSSVSFPF